MFLLRLLFELTIPCFLLFILITQLIIPAFTDRPVFPMFRKSETKTKVSALREQVSDLRDEAASLEDLASLKQREAALKQRIAEIENAKLNGADSSH